MNSEEMLDEVIEKAKDWNIETYHIEWLIQQAKKLEEIKNAFYRDDFSVVDYMRVSAKVFEGKEPLVRNKSE